MPNFKKVISAVCAFAMLATSVTVSVFADDDTAVDTLASSTYEGKVFYDETFNDMTAGTKANMQNGANTTYKTSNGITLACGTRSGDYDSVRVEVNAAGKDGNGIYFYGGKYNDSNARKPYIELSKIDTVYNQLQVNFSAKFANTASSISLSDGSKSIAVSSSSPVDLSLDTWYDFTILSYPDNKSYTIITKDADGNLIDITDGSGYLAGLTTITGLGSNSLSAYLDNLQVYDFAFPRFTVEDVERLNVGETTQIATIYDSGSIDVSGDNSGCVYDTTDGVVTVTPSDSASAGEVNVTVKTAAEGYSRTVEFTKTYSINDEAGFAQESADDIDLVEYNSSTQNVTGTTELTASGNFNVPVSDRNAEISWESDNTDIIEVSKSGKATVSYPDESTKVTLTATIKYGSETVTRDFVLNVMTAEENVKNAVSNLTITANSNITVSGTTVTASGNFTVPIEYSGTSVTWESSDEDAVSVDADGTVHVYPSADSATLTATLTTGSNSATKEFTVNLAAYHTEYQAAFDQAVDEATYLYYLGDTSCADIITEATDGAIVYNDLYFPTSTTVTVGSGDSSKTYSMENEWTVSSNSYINSDGTLNVSDMDLHENVATITRTIKYVKDGKTVMSADKSYTVSTQFNPDDIETIIEELVEANYPIDTGSPERETASREARDAAAAKYKLAFVDTNRIKYDAAYEDNFEDIASSLSSGESTTLKTTGFFGSTLSWASSSTYLKVSTSTTDSTKTCKATASSVSSDVAATLTCTISSGAAETKTYTANVTVNGTGKKSSGGGSSGGGSSSSSSSGGDTRTNTGSGTVATGDLGNVTVTPSPVTSTDPNPSGFIDLDDVSWALTAINNLYVNGVVNGKETNLFYPNDSVTRAEFAKMLVLTFDITPIETDTATFNDVPTSNWASEYVEAAYKSGIVEGFDDGSFEPNSEITRQDMAVMVYRAATTAGYTIEEKTEAVTFSDDSIIASYSKDAVSALQKAKIVSGLGDGSFGPLDTSTRAQACQIIYNVFNK